MAKLGVNIDHSATLRQARYREVPAGSKIIVEPNPTEIALLAEKDIDGGLIGGAALKADSFVALIESASKAL